jgi:hypothetical protein
MNTVIQRLDILLVKLLVTYTSDYTTESYCLKYNQYFIRLVD